jgi:Uma2 family endonuclease
MQEIELSDAVKPYLEWVDNRILPKVSPTPLHAWAQGNFDTALRAWAVSRASGFVGPELRFQVEPPGEIRRTLVPDVAYVSFERISVEELKSHRSVRVAPDAVVEVRSVDDRQEDVDEKVRVYLAAGTRVVFLVDPEKRAVLAVDRSGVHDLSAGPVTHEALPAFSLEPALLFDFPKPPDHLT